MMISKLKWYVPNFKKYIQPKLDEFEIAPDTYPPGIELYDQFYTYFYCPYGKHWEQFYLTDIPKPEYTENFKKS